MAKQMSAFALRVHARTSQGALDDAADRTRVDESVSRSATANKDPPRRAAWPTMLNIARQGVTDLCNEGDLGRAVTLTVQRQLARSSIDVIEGEADHFASAQTQPREQ